MYKLTLIASCTLLIATGALAKEHPCKTLKEACSNGGFIKGEAKTNKGLIKNCLAVLLKGGSVPGVMVSAEMVQACKDKRAEAKRK